MNLLPKTGAKEFGERDYWNKFFKQRGKKAFDWYGEYPELCGTLHKYIKPKDDVLMLGCGNSKLSADLYDVGYKKMINIDISQVVVNQMIDLNGKDRPGMEFTQMDATNMTFADNSFSVALDKGTLDALMPDDDQETLDRVFKYWSEISRVLRTGGRYICISLLQEHILKHVVEFFPRSSFMLRIVRCLEAEEKTSSENPDGFAMPVFAIVATKFIKLPQKILEVNLVGDQIVRFVNEKEVFEEITTAQQSALVCSNLTKSNKAAKDEIRIDLFKPGTSNIPRYTIFVIDREVFKSKLGKFAAFIVPHGRETDWLFSTKEGRKKLLDSADYNRLAVVVMYRDQDYNQIDDIKAELSENVKRLAPNNVKNELIPFLSLGNDVGHRDVVYKGSSEMSGDFVVEEVPSSNGQLFRRLVFMNNQFVVQSEALIKKVKAAKHGDVKKVVDLSYLACQHHLYMTIGTQASVQQYNQSAKALVIGLGGGGLCTFMQQSIRNLKITAVEIDKTMQEVAVEYFGLKESNNLEVIIEDGLKYLKSSAKQGLKFDAILFDVDSKDSSQGISCPPKAFLDPVILAFVQDCLTENGIFILNLVCRDEQLKADLRQSLAQLFPLQISYKLDEEVNEVVFCMKRADFNLQNAIVEAAEKINQEIRRSKLNSSELIDVDELSNSLKTLKC